MASFPPSVAALLLANCRRHCCICLRWAGQRMHIHHIVPDSEDGPGDYDNGIPVCLDCHAEIESKSNMGRRFSPEELKLLRQRWFKTVAENPEVLIRASQAQVQTGPLEALFAELNFNLIGCYGPLDESFPPLAVDQFKRAIATNALAALEEKTKTQILLTYRLVGIINQQFEELARVDRAGGHGSAWAATAQQQRMFRLQALSSIQQSMTSLGSALGWGDLEFRFS